MHIIEAIYSQCMTVLSLSIAFNLKKNKFRPMEVNFISVKIVYA